MRTNGGEYAWVYLVDYLDQVVYMTTRKNRLPRSTSSAADAAITSRKSEMQSMPEAAGVA